MAPPLHRDHVLELPVVLVLTYPDRPAGPICVKSSRIGLVSTVSEAVRHILHTHIPKAIERQLPVNLRYMVRYVSVYVAPGGSSDGPTARPVKYEHNLLTGQFEDAYIWEPWVQRLDGLTQSGDNATITVVVDKTLWLEVEERLGVSG